MKKELVEFSAYWIKGLSPLSKVVFRFMVEKGDMVLTEGSLKDCELTEREKNVLKEFFEIPKDEQQIILRHLPTIKKVLCREHEAWKW